MKHLLETIRPQHPALKHCAYCHAVISGEDTYCSSDCQEADIYE